MRVEIQIARGDPQNPGAGGANWSVGQTVFMIVFPFDARWRIGWFFNLIAQFGGLDHDDIVILMIDASLTAAQVDRVREVKGRSLPLQKVCLLDGGLQLAGLTANQIRARVG